MSIYYFFLILVGFLLLFFGLSFYFPKWVLALGAFLKGISHYF